MPHYRVRLFKTVNDTLDAIVEVEADTPEEAGTMAYDQAVAPDSKVEWKFTYAGEGDDPEIDSVTECEPTLAEPNLGDDPLGDWHGRNE